ncbi:MAG: glycosyltransferase family 39 protein [Salibacteraceae bacterium]|nr:glycosyltransferase family 39 protein [Salibacteraceae bacterium]
MKLSNSTIILLLVALCIPYIMGIVNIDVMDVDASQYASISREMLENGDYLQVKHRQGDYLDKPPLLFWTSALSFKIFGIGLWQYRLFSLLLSILGIWSVYQLGKSLYDKLTGQFSALILASTQAFFLINHDVRTDTLLCGAIAFAVWQLHSFLATNAWKNLIGGFLGIAMAMLSKGPIGIMVPVLALGTHMILSKQLNKLLNWKWLAGFAVVALCLLPMSIGLYQQWGFKGLRFYYWTQSFGRITGESEWNNNTGFEFFLHTFLWAFLPWSLLAIGALLNKFRHLKQGEYLTLGGFLLPFIALSFSKYKLPHYIFVTFPFLAILTGHYIKSFLEKGKLLKRWYVVHLLILVLLLLMGFAPITYPFGFASFWLFLLIAVYLAVFIYFSFQTTPKPLKIITLSVIAISTVNLGLNGHFYPKLMHYQSGSEMAKYVLDQKIDLEKIHPFNYFDHSFEFHTGVRDEGYNLEIINKATRNNETFWINTTSEYDQHLTPFSTFETERVYFEKYPVTKLKARFLNPETRKETLKQGILIRYN